MTEEIGNELRILVMNDINENGYISVEKFLNIFEYGIHKLPGNKDVKEIFLTVIHSFPDNVAKLFILSSSYLEYNEKNKIIKLKSKIKIK